MKYACIDVGSNSVRLLMADYINKKLQNRVKKLCMTRLGYGVNETKMLDPHRMIETLETIDKFYHTAIKNGAREVFIFATAAVRDAFNGIDFRQMVYNKTEIEIEIISGNMEANLGFAGVCEGHDCYEDQKILVLDIGGGSTEFIIGSKNQMEDSISLDIGSVKLTSGFITSDPINEDELKTLQEHISRNLKMVKKLFKMRKVNDVIGIGGTATTFSAIANKIDRYEPGKLHGSFVDINKIREINNKLQSLDLQARQKIVGLDSRRADIITAGGLILQGAMELFESKNLMASDFDNLEGYLVKRINKEKI